MIKLLVVLMFLAGALAYAWRRLSQPRRAQIITTAQQVGVKVRDMGRALADRMQRRRSAYRHIFLSNTGELSPAGTIVLAHLTKFCYAMTTTAQEKVSADELMRREGRRQVWIMLMAQLSASPVEALNAAMQEEVVLG